MLTMLFYIETLFSIFYCIYLCVEGNFNPFMDNDLFAINWAGPASDSPDFPEKVEGSDESVIVQTAIDEKYQCILPESQDSKDANAKKNYAGPTPDEIMTALFSQSSCSYRIESYWTYELCHGRHIRQYHENKELGAKKSQVQEYFLGHGKPRKRVTEAEKTETYGSDDVPGSDDRDDAPEPTQIKSKKIDGIDLPYYEVNMTGGTPCDLTTSPRQSRVLYICQPDGRGEVYLMKETSTCEYELVVLTSVLCVHPEFRPKNPPVGQIHCHALDGSPQRPRELQKLEVEAGKYTSKQKQFQTMFAEDVEQEAVEVNIPVPPKVEPPPDHKVDTHIGVEADKQLLREFLGGDYCLQGGSGWWKHEFCYKKHARQFHDDPEGRKVLYLGHWNEEKHMKWLVKNPGKRPKPVGRRQHISLYYSDGDVCDLTQKSRFVEVRLRCLEDASSSHAVSIYLIEPRTCEYVLAVESPILCSLIDKADENGLIPTVDV